MKQLSVLSLPILAVDDVATTPDVYRARMPVDARTFEALGLPDTLVGADRPQCGVLRSP
jgi:hypothetical protein